MPNCEQIVDRVIKKTVTPGRKNARNKKGLPSSGYVTPFPLRYTLVLGDERPAETTATSAAMPRELAYDIWDYLRLQDKRGSPAKQSFFEQVVAELCTGKICVEMGCGGAVYFEHEADAEKMVAYYTAQ